jgi:drug/metabolite transporter (DMT)-like permease
MPTSSHGESHSSNPAVPTVPTIPLPPTAVASMLLVVLIWGLNFTVTKLAFREFPPLAFTAVRFGLSSLCILLVLRWVEGTIGVPRGAWVPLTLLGIIGNSAYQILFVLGLERTTATNSSLVLASMPALVAAFGAMSATEHLSQNGKRGLALASLGVILVVAAQGVEFSARTLTGDALTVAAVICWAVFTVGIRRLDFPMSPLAITAWTTILGTPVLVAAGLPDMLAMNWAATSIGGWGGVLYSSLLSLIFAYVLWNRSIRVVGSNRTAIFACVTPLVATGTAVLVLGERPAPAQLAGGALVLVGVLLSQRAASPPAPPGEPSPA